MNALNPKGGSRPAGGTSPEAGPVARGRLTRVVVIVAALLVSAYIVTGSKTTLVEAPPTFDMLAYLDQQVAVQEDAKDVRCWSSFCKLQMFITGATIDEDAAAVRVEKHMELIESIWDEARRGEPDALFVGEESVSTVLARRFPHRYEETKGASFLFSGDDRTILIDAASLQDYSDTIEPWRLLQAWASRQTDASGRLTKTPPFNESALKQMYEFLRKYDLAILKHARLIAEKNKKSGVDASSMEEGFTLEGKLRN